MQNDFYQRNLHKLIEWHKQRQNDYSDLFNSLCIKSEDEARKLGTLEGLGKEDARYALGQATQAQIGLTVSARNLEVLITKLRSSSIAEFQEIGEELFKEIDGVAPSVIKYTNPSDYFAKTRKELREHVSKIPIFNERAFSKIGADVLLHTNLHRDYSITSGLIFSSSDISYTAALFLVNNVLNKNNLIELLDIADKYQQAHDPKLREYELGDRIAEITLSASAFAQLKRHRMDTLIPQRYNPSLGWTTPDSIMGTKIADDLEVITNASSALYKDMLASDVPFEVADYALTNAHRRRVLFDSNNRQVHAFCMERENLPAQWDIRRLANQYHELLQQESPLTLRNLTGKDKFYEVKQNQQSK
jgi:thymidylate synthase ThyX